MKAISKIILIGSLLVSHSIYANIPLSCQQHYSSDWRDNSDPSLSITSMSLAGTEGSDQNGTVRIFLSNDDRSISYDGFIGSCTKQKDGSLKFQLTIDDEVSLNMVTTDGVTMNILPGSYMPLKMFPPNGPFAGEAKGPFVLTRQGG